MNRNQKIKYILLGVMEGMGKGGRNDQERDITPRMGRCFLKCYQENSVPINCIKLFEAGISGKLLQLKH